MLLAVCNTMRDSLPFESFLCYFGGWFVLHMSKVGRDIRWCLVFVLGAEDRHDNFANARQCLCISLDSMRIRIVNLKYVSYTF